MRQFAAKSARPLPVIILADTSGSMSVDGKIEALNKAMAEMIRAFSAESRLNAEIHLAVISFGGIATEHLSLTPAQKIEGFIPFQASGGTPMGEAITLARKLIEDKEQIPSRAYRPVVVLISDGHPTDNYISEFEAFRHSERSQKATRMAMSIGADADDAMMTDFINDLESPLFKAHNAQDIIKFFRAVSMSVSARSRSTTPNQLELPKYDDIPDDELDLDF